MLLKKKWRTDGGASRRGWIIDSELSQIYICLILFLSGMDRKSATFAAILAIPLGLLSVFTIPDFIPTVPAVLLFFIGTAYYLYTTETLQEAIGAGFYIASLLLLLAPVSIFVPAFFGADDGTAVVASLVGLFMLGFAAVLVAIVLATIGRFFSQRAVPPE
jgi:hypothetical protein